MAFRKSQMGRAVAILLSVFASQIGVQSLAFADDGGAKALKPAVVDAVAKVIRGELETSDTLLQYLRTKAKQLPADDRLSIEINRALDDILQ